MSFFFFIPRQRPPLFIRPAELVPGLVGWRIYEPLILACAATALAELIGYLTGRSLSSQPDTLCVFGLLLVIVLSFLFALRLDKGGRTRASSSPRSSSITCCW